MKTAIFLLSGLVGLGALATNASAQLVPSTSAQLNRLQLNQARCAATPNSEVCYREYAQKIGALKVTLVKPVAVIKSVAVVKPVAVIKSVAVVKPVAVIKSVAVVKPPVAVVKPLFSIKPPVAVVKPITVAAPQPVSSTSSELNRLQLNQAQCAAISSSDACYYEYAQKIAVLKATLVKPIIVVKPVVKPIIVVKPPVTTLPVVAKPVIMEPGTVPGTRSSGMTVQGMPTPASLDPAGMPIINYSTGTGTVVTTSTNTQKTVTGSEATNLLQGIMKVNTFKTLLPGMPIPTLGTFLGE